MKKRISGLLFLITLLVGQSAFAQYKCVAETTGTQSMATESIVLVNDAGVEISLEVWVADDAFERAAGYQYICPDVIDKTRILFEYRQPIDGKFHMQNVRAPLDIAFFDDAGNVIKTMLMATYTSNSQPLYGPGMSFKYALEARKGFFAENNVMSPASHLKLGSVQ